MSKKREGTTKSLSQRYTMASEATSKDRIKMTLSVKSCFLDAMP
ncbi:MAG: hypothetical protein AB1442_17745 [Nitrospirota bacterium]